MSPSSVGRLLTRFPNLKSVELAPPGFRVLDELPDTQVSLSKALGLESAFPKVCAVSMMVWPEKVEGLKLLIRSMPIIAQSFPSARLLIVGDGHLRPEIEKEIDASNARSLVVLAGTQANPAPFISLSDVFAHISFRDTFGQSLLEALSIGRASVVNHEVAQNLPARLAQEGVLAVAPSEVEVAEAVKRLALNADLRERLGREGQRLVKETLGWDNVAREMLATYRGRALRGP
jgi:glycosyltransferase involved in cell wall biosynthesis